MANRPRNADHVYADKQLVIARTALPSQLSIMGAIDRFNADAVATALEVELQRIHGGIARTGQPESADERPHIDLSQVEFTDTCGIRALIHVAKGAGDRGGLVLHGLPPLIQRVIELLKAADLPRVVIEAEQPGSLE